MDRPTGGVLTNSMDSFVTGVLSSAGLPPSSAASGQVREAVRTIEQALRAKANIADRLADEVISRNGAERSPLRRENETLKSEVARLREREEYLEAECASLTQELKGLASMVIEDDNSTFSLDAVAAASVGAARATRFAAAESARSRSGPDSAALDTCFATPPPRPLSSPGAGSEDDTTDLSTPRSQSRGSRVLLSVLQESKAARGAEVARATTLQQRLSDSEHAKAAAETSSASKGRQVERLRQAAESARAEVDRLSAELHRESNECTCLREELTVLNEQMTLMVGKRGQRERDWLKLEEEAAELRIKMDAAEASERRMRDSLVSLEDRLADSIKAGGALRGRTSALEGELMLAREEEAACREAMDTALERLRQVQAEKVQLESAHDDQMRGMASTVGHWGSQMGAGGGTTAAASEQLISAEASVIDLKAQVARLQRQLQASEARTAESGKAFKELRESMTSSLTKSNTSVTDSEQRVKEMEAKMHTMRRSHSEDVGLIRQQLLDEQSEHEITRQQVKDVSATEEERFRWEKSRADAAEQSLQSERQNMETALESLRSLQEESRLQRVRADDAEAALSRTSRSLADAGDRLAGFQKRFQEESAKMASLEHQLADDKESLRQVTAELSTANSKLREGAAALDRAAARETEAQQTAERMRVSRDAAESRASAAAETVPV